MTKLFVTPHAQERYRQRFAENYDLPTDEIIRRVRALADRAVPFGIRFGTKKTTVIADDIVLVLGAARSQKWPDGAVVTVLTREEAMATMAVTHFDERRARFRR